MSEPREKVVVRLGHRPGRDERTTTHVGLTARALGADRVVLPDRAGSAVETVRDVTERFGGPFHVEVVERPRTWLDDWGGSLVHLTMYGLPVDETVGEIRTAVTGDDLAIVVGAGKVPPELYDLATWNVAVTNQPHSEIAALAIFLDRLVERPLTDLGFEGADDRVIPTAAGKRVVSADDDEL